MTTHTVTPPIEIEKRETSSNVEWRRATSAEATHAVRLTETLNVVLRAFLAERRALAATLDHANGNLTDDELASAIREANALRVRVHGGDMGDYMAILARHLGTETDSEVLASILGVDIDAVHRALDEMERG